MKVEFKFENGQKVKDMVSGCVGIINASSIWLNGCIQYSVQPEIKKGEMPDSWWFDEKQIELIDEGINKKVKPSNTGGPPTRSPRL